MIDLPMNKSVCGPERTGTVQTFCFIGKESIDLGDGTIEGNDSEAVVCCIEDEVLTHDGQTDETEVTFWLTVVSVRSADIDAGETRTIVSIHR